MLERLRGIMANLNAQPTAVRVVLIVAAFVLAVLLSRVLVVVAVLALLVSLFALVVRLLRRRPLRGWGIAALASLASIFVFTGIANAVYGPPEPNTQKQAAAPEPTVEETTQPRETTREETTQPSGTAAKEKTEEKGKTTPKTAEPTQPAKKDGKEDDRSGSRTSVTVSRVVDGDTVEITPAKDGIEDLRFIGVDTPETRDPDCGVQPYGDEASEFTESELEGEEVELEFDEDREDRYNRLLAYVYKDGDMFNETLLEEGYAQVYTVPPNDRYVDRFEEAQEEAQAAERGIWGLAAAEQGELADRENGIGGSGCADEQNARPKPEPKPKPQPKPQPKPEPRPEPEPQPEPEPVPEPEPKPTPQAEPQAPAPAPAGDYDCSDFGSKAEAQPFLLPGDPYGLDRDGDGQACDSLR